MGFIAKGTITLETVTDAHSLSLTRPSCAIHADFDGSNPILTDANTVITVSRGANPVAFTCTELGKSDGLVYTLTKQSDGKSWLLAIEEISTELLEGYVTLGITANDDYYTEIQFTYTVVRESSMLDWIQDWEGGKTKIGNTYIMTPKLFIGKRSQYADYAEGGSNAKDSIASVPGLTGVYIGPDTDSTGIYGYKNSVEIFHLNNDGGMIGGWTINQDGIYSKDGLLSILGEGSIKAVDSDGSTVWEARSDGYASFAKEAIKLYADGNAEFSGKITSSSGSIGGWNITENQISKNNLYLDTKTNAVGVARHIKTTATDSNGNGEADVLSEIKSWGGVAIYYTSDSDWGLIGYGANTDTSKTGEEVFTLGPSNKIAAWSFDNDALWSGTKNNTANAYTSSGITIGSNGLRSTKWRFEADGSGALAGGNLYWDENGSLSVSGKIMATSGSIGGVTINSNSIGTNAYSLNSDGSASFANGKVAFYSNGSGSLAGGNLSWDTSGNLTVRGTVYASAGEFAGKITATSGSIGGITINSNSIATSTYSLNSDGSASFAGGNITFSSDGSGSLKNIHITGSIRSDIALVGAGSTSTSSDVWSFNTNYTSNYNWAPKNDKINPIGRTIHIFNYRYNGVTQSGTSTITLTDGSVFFEDGIQKTRISISRQGITLFGLGDNGTFLGWVVMNRCDIATEHAYGKQLRLLAYGYVVGTSSGATLKHYHTYDGSSMSVSRSDTGKYTVNHNFNIYNDGMQGWVSLTGVGAVVEDEHCPCKATLMSIASNSFVVWTSDDDSVNDGSFSFMLYNCSDFNWS